ncbi:mitoguardin 1-like [Colossoma macropomum]|uniref:mitoguardin 1-like n=1 Tax=Colossoma macropomum TaxID=42526 RepID=UPI001865170B|nr:mitoguardin 1-like [Colossoma macropomum]
MEQSTSAGAWWALKHMRVVEIGWEKQPQEGDTELRALSVSVRPYLPEHENDEFISVKLNAVRQAFEIIIADPEHRRFFKETGFTLLSGLLALAGKRNVGFGLMWEQLMTFLENSSNWRTIAEECQEAGMQWACFYDIFYESIVLKLLECKEHIPATLKQTLHIPWISASMKKTTVMFYAWSQIKKKRLCMTRDHGLYHHLYEVFDYVDPEIMWAAFGLQSEAKDYYFLLRSQVLAFIRHIFSLRRSWYDSPARLTSPIYSAWQDLVWKLQCYLEENIG